MDTAIVWGTSEVWGDSVIRASDAAIVWGTSGVWGDNTNSGFSGVWGGDSGV